MRGARVITLVIALIMVSILGGCAKTWSVNFTTVPDIDDWVLKSYYALDPQGLILANDNYVTAPCVWTGDFTITVKFKLAATISNRVFGAIWVAGTTGTAEDMLSFYYYYGGSIDPSFGLWVDGSAHPQVVINSSSTLVPGIRNDDINTYVLKKAGEHFTATLNNVELGDWDDITYDSVNFYLTLNSAFLAANEIIYKSVSVRYEDGNMTPVL